MCLSSVRVCLPRSDRMAKHFPGWKGLHEMGKRDANIGFWHETYFVKSGQYESIYSEPTCAVWCLPFMLIIQSECHS